MSENKKTKLNYMVEIQPKEYEPGNTPVEGPEDFDYSEKAEQNLSSAENIKPSMAHAAGNLVMDFSPILVGSGIGKVIGTKFTNKMLQRLVNNKGNDEKANKFANKIVHSSEKQTKKLEKALHENAESAKRLADRTIVPKKALNTVLKNSVLEAKIGPDWASDIPIILGKEAKLSNKEINKIMKSWIKKNMDSPDLISLIEAKDPNYTFGHSVRVSRLTKDLALEAGLPTEQAEILGQAALLHDMGKIATQQRVLDSSDYFKMSKSGRDKFLYDHDINGYNILENTDPFAAKIAKSHHPLHKRTENRDINDELVTIADLYDAISGDRSYKGSKSKKDTLDIIEKDSIPKGETSQEFLDLLLKLDEKGKLSEFYPVESDLSEAFIAMKKNAIENYAKKHISNKATMLGTALGTAFTPVTRNLDKGGVLPTNLPTISEIKEGLIPSSRDKKELIEDISRWYENGLFENNPEAIKAIANTDFSKAKEVRKLWKYLDEVSKDHN